MAAVHLDLPPGSSPQRGYYPRMMQAPHSCTEKGWEGSDATITTPTPTSGQQNMTNRQQ